MKIEFKRLTFIKYLFLFILCGFIVYVYVNILQHKIINPDAGYYLWIVNKISEGKSPGIDIRTGYMPLSFYLLSLVKIFSDFPTYFLYLYILLIVQLLNALLVYLIAKIYTNDKFILAFSFLFYLLLSFHSDGSFFVLEPFVNLFGLISILLYLRIKNWVFYWMLVPGILAALAFFCKQYGLVYFLAVPILLIIDSNKNFSALKRTVLYLIGYCIPIILFVLYLKFEKGGLKELITLYSGSGYGQRSIDAYLSGIFTLIKIYGIFLPFSLWILFKDGFRNHILVYLYLIFGFSLQFFFYKFPHYYILLIPHLVLCAVITSECLLKKSKLRLIFIFSLSFAFLINIYADIKTTIIFSGLNSKLGKDFTEMTQNAIQINKYVGQNDKVLLSDFDLAPYYFLGNLNPPLEKEFGIVSSDIVSKDKYLENMEQTDFILIWKNSLSRFYTEINSGNFKWVEIRISNNIFLLKKDVINK